MWHGLHYGGWWMFIPGVLFWFGIVALVIWGVRRFGRHDDEGRYGGWRRSPLDILKERYARGEITKQEYEDMKRDLRD
ncbi:MAG TPA: SHOCT domain-containing protein [Candidatus Heimdallarchaeota archaeon]|nr:SHOCT domain-containing protein [Candidatus Heimdallarchaeota archaeon]